jgi:nitrite reductase/ring-hydroxylating ferredoxin subunit
MVEKQLLCRLEEIPEGSSRGFSAQADAPYADILVVRLGEGVYAYRNRCPHTGAPMEWQPDQFLDYQGRYIQCGIHGALFRIEDGYCIAGPCVRQSLGKIAVAVQDGFIVALEDLERWRD